LPIDSAASEIIQALDIDQGYDGTKLRRQVIQAMLERPRQLGTLGLFLRRAIGIGKPARRFDFFVIIVTGSRGVVGLRLRRRNSS